MDRLKHIAELGDFIPHGDDSFIDDQGMTNRWAERRRQRAIAERIVREDAERRRAQQAEILTAQEANAQQPTAHQRDMAMEEIRNREEEIRLG